MQGALPRFNIVMSKKKGLEKDPTDYLGAWEAEWRINEAGGWVVDKTCSNNTTDGKWKD